MTRHLRTWGTLLLCGFISASVAGPVAAQGSLRTLTFGLTAKTANEWPEYVSDKLGFFAANGIKADIIYTGSSAAGAQQLTAGSLDVSEVSSTQLIEAVQGGAPIVAIIEHSTKAPYTLVGKKGVNALRDLKGKTIIVGGPNDITRVFTDKMFSAAKLAPNDYAYTFAGATSARFAALMNGGVDAAILFPPFSFKAVSLGYPAIDEVQKYFPSFLFDTFCVQPSWAKTHGDLLVAFGKSYLQGVRWLYNPANKARAIQILSEATNTSAEDASQTYDLFIAKVKIYSTTGLATAADINPVIDALVKTGELKPPPPPASKFYDNAYIQEANKQLGRP
jgi:NitT/TauT family transport system substrate-binding protein